MDANRLNRLRTAALEQPRGLGGSAVMELFDHIDQQQAEIERLNKENAELHNINVRLHHDLDDAPGIQDLQSEKIRDLEQELERLNRAYEVLEGYVSELGECSSDSIMDACANVLSEAQRIKEGKDVDSQ
jgi:chromosome segregation ATPase